MKTRLLFVCLMAGLPLQGCAVEDDPRIPGATYILDATLVTSDGVKLVMDIILPQGDGPFPVILWRSPYNKDGVTNGEARSFVEEGYAAVSQDTRGRFKSEGVWDAFRYERRDGYETQEWIGRQKWCNGRIATAGGSYLGFTQCISAPEASRYLKAMCPEVPWGNTYHDCLYTGGAFHLQLAMFWGAAQHFVKTGKPLPDLNKGNLFSYLPLGAWDDSVGDRIQYLRDWVAHPTHDDYWEDHEVGDRIADVSCAALYVGGWFDIFCDGVIDYWKSVRTRAQSESVRNSQFLVIGPWTHGGSAADGKVGDLAFGPQSAFKKSPARADFFDEYVRCRDSGFSQAHKPFALFVMGANRWREVSEWPLPQTQYRDLYLAGAGVSNTSSGKGILSWQNPVGEAEPDRFAYNPNNPVPTHGGQLLWPTAGPRDQSEIEHREDVLVYTSEILAETLEVTGPVVLKLFAASSAPDTDFTAKLVDVYPGEEGKPYGILDGILRTSFRDSDKTTSLIEPGKVYEYTLNLGCTSNAFLPGHRLRLEVSSSNFPRFDRNLNTGHPFGQDDQTAVALQTVYRDSGRPSHLVLPVIPN